MGGGVLASLSIDQVHVTSRSYVSALVKIPSDEVKKLAISSGFFRLRNARATEITLQHESLILAQNERWRQA